MRTRTVLTAMGIAMAGMLATQFSHAGTLENVKKRGELRCGVSDGLAGFSAPDAKGRWQGIDTEMCRAVATAVFGNPEKVTFVPLPNSERFTALQSGEVDMLSRNTTWSASRDNSMGLSFPGGVLFYDGQGFLVHKDAGVTSPKELDGATVCTQSGSTSEMNMADFFASHNLHYQAVTFESPAQLLAAFEGSRCDSISIDSSQLAALRSQLKDPNSGVILPEMISKEPLAPMVRRGDEAWGKVVSWTLYAMLNAEEMGITSKNVDALTAAPKSPDMARLLGKDGDFGKQLGLSNDWAHNIVKNVGNYGEIFDRTVGEHSPLKLARGKNALWNAGGFQYAPPVR
ncbi:amino acid ABC transporter substrate-binding protein [Zymobacter sp. IVIA_5232.4 C2]|uniref:amino acid ABC transporter substrate-binding protein n=1 Tax=Zymobacter sp. IVIA_5232.4 C2 TaxID=3394855 RepID=UPI0039C35787